MQLYYIRHGESANNALWARTGSSEERVVDPKLTEIGERQAALVAKFVAGPRGARAMPLTGNGEALRDWDPQNVGGFPVTHCYCSLMERAVQTGHEIAEALDLPLRVWADIHETGGMFLTNPETGEREGKPGLARSYLKRTYPRIVLPDLVTDEGWWNRPFEERAARQERADGVLRELLDRHGDSDDGAVFVSHGGFFNHLLWAMLPLGGEGPVDGELWFAANNASISRFDYAEGRWIVNYLNRVDFLPAELIT
jgi:2,3-bisphosphoglycerate-dependent phosphoglycerate mutase